MWSEAKKIGVGLGIRLSCASLKEGILVPWKRGVEMSHHRAPDAVVNEVAVNGVWIVDIQLIWGHPCCFV